MRWLRQSQGHSQRERGISYPSWRSNIHLSKQAEHSDEKKGILYTYYIDLCVYIPLQPDSDYDDGGGVYISPHSEQKARPPDPNHKEDKEEGNPWELLRGSDRIASLGAESHIPQPAASSWAEIEGEISRDQVKGAACSVQRGKSKEKGLCSSQTPLRWQSTSTEKEAED